MQLHDIKQVSIVDYLAQIGYKPKLTKGVNYWYCSPLRTELTPSFKVNAERNQWYDFATGDHGDIIDLVCALQHCSTVEAMRRLATLNGVRLAPSFFFWRNNSRKVTNALNGAHQRTSRKVSQALTVPL